MKKYWTILLLGFSIVSCEKDTIEPNCTSDTDSCPVISDDFKYLFLSHTRNNDLHLIDSRIPQINFAQFDGLLLGGDLSYQSSQDDATLNALDDIFDLSSLTTLWALGNHDIMDRSLIQAKTGRNSYYAYYQNGTTFIVLDTELVNSNILGTQLDFFNSVVDTITVSKNVVVLHHKLMWMQGNVDMDPIINDISNGEAGTCGYCLDDNNFYTDLYPKLVLLENAGKNVYCLGGDAGNKVSYYEYTSPEGVEYFANGTSYLSNDIYGLVITQSPSDSSLAINLTNVTCIY